MEGQPAVAAEGKKIRIKPEKKRKSKRGEKREENVKKKIRSTSLPAELLFRQATVCNCKFQEHSTQHRY